MFSTLRNRFGIPGVISVIALVFAMFGGAYAASNSSGGPKATASAKAKAGPRGKTGKTGPAGPAGPAGAKGDAGKDGAQGPQGNPGAQGSPGSAGASATTEAFAGTKGPCTAGGVTVKSASPEVNVCNGKNGTNGTNGTNGEDGETGFTETLPEGQTETGSWGYGETTTVGNINVPISFAIPLASPPPPFIDPVVAHFIYTDGNELVIGVNASEELLIEKVPPTACHGTPGAPVADPGNLCVFATEMTGTLDEMEPFNTGIALRFGSGSISNPGSPSPAGGGAGTTGAHLQISLFTGSTEAWGTWAVTAPVTP